MYSQSERPKLPIDCVVIPGNRMLRMAAAAVWIFIGDREIIWMGPCSPLAPPFPPGSASGAAPSAAGAPTAAGAPAAPFRRASCPSRSAISASLRVRKAGSCRAALAPSGVASCARRSIADRALRAWVRRPVICVTPSALSRAAASAPSRAACAASSPVPASARWIWAWEPGELAGRARTASSIPGLTAIRARRWPAAIWRLASRTGLDPRFRKIRLKRTLSPAPNPASRMSCESSAKRLALPSL